MKSALLPTIAMALAALPALADEPANATPEAKPYPKGITCAYVPTFRGSGYGVIDPKHLIIDGSGRHKFLVTLFTNCWELQRTIGIGIDRRGASSELCTGDAIIADGNRCVIRYVEEVANRKEAESIVEGRKAAAEAARKNGE